MRHSVLTLLLIAACGQSQVNEPVAPVAEPPAEAPAAPTAAAMAKEEPAKKVALTSTVTEDNFELALKPAGPYEAGKLGHFAIAIASKGEWHLNEDYPTEVRIKGPAALSFPKATLAKADAAQFEETRAKFEVPFTAAGPGEHMVECEVSFAVCTDETCIPDTRTLALALPVK